MRSTRIASARRAPCGRGTRGASQARNPASSPRSASCCARARSARPSSTWTLTLAASSRGVPDRAAAPRGAGGAAAPRDRGGAEPARARRRRRCRARCRPHLVRSIQAKGSREVTSRLPVAPRRPAKIWRAREDARIPVSRATGSRQTRQTFSSTLPPGTSRDRTRSRLPSRALGSINRAPKISSSRLVVVSCRRFGAPNWISRSKTGPQQWEPVMNSGREASRMTAGSRDRWVFRSFESLLPLQNECDAGPPTWAAFEVSAGCATAA